MSSVTIGVVLPESHFGSEEWKNAENALEYVDKAVEDDVNIVFFPEGYPGPATGPLQQEELGYQPLEALQEKADQHDVWISASDVEPNPEIKDTFYLTQKLISPDGDIAARYLRVQPDTPPLNAYLYDGKAHLLPGDEFVVEDIGPAKLGLCICSELWVPEIPRILMLNGAEIVFAPVHGLHSTTMHDGTQLADTWRCIARARAAENTSYVIVTQNAYKVEGFDYESNIAAGALVASPEEMVASRDKPGILNVELEMDRIQYLRSRNYDEEILSRPEGSDSRSLGCRPGQIWERDPTLFKQLAEPSQYSFNYDYYKTDLDAWIDEYEETIYKGDYNEILERYGKLTFHDEPLDTKTSRP